MKKLFFTTVRPVLVRALMLTMLSGLLFADRALAQAQQETLPPIAEYVISDELGGRDKEGFLAGLTEATNNDPNLAPDIVKAALEFKTEEIKETPGYATEIVLAVLAGIPENLRTPDFIAAVIDSAVGALRGLPEGQGNVPANVVEAVMASLPPETALQVRNLIMNGSQGALRDLVVFIYTAPPAGAGMDPTPTPADQDEEDDEPKEDEVTPIHSGSPSPTPSPSPII